MMTMACALVSLSLAAAPAEARPPRWVPYMVAGWGAVVAGTGALLWHGAANDLKDLQALSLVNPKPAEPGVARLRDRGKALTGAAVASFVVGALAVISGLVWAVLDAKAPVVVLAPTPDGGLVALSFRWP